MPTYLVTLHKVAQAEAVAEVEVEAPDRESAGELAWEEAYAGVWHTDSFQTIDQYHEVEEIVHVSEGG